MGSPCPPLWTFAARAAYFGDRMCAFCDHRNPAGAKFCNECASPLHLQPCKQCDAVNDQAATNCYKCGAACPVSRSDPRATPVLPAADATPAWAIPGDAAVAATVTQPSYAAPPLRTAWRLLRSGQFRVAAVAMVLIVSAYHGYRVNVTTPETTGVSSRPIDAPEDVATTALPAVPVGVESTHVEPERTVALQASNPATDAEAPQRASVRRGPASAPATKRASAHQRAVPERQAPVGAPAPAAHGLAAARVGPRVAQTTKALRPDPWQVMRVSLARCGGDLIARIVCDQRVRRHFCEGHWGQAAECAGGIANEHGQ